MKRSAFLSNLLSIPFAAWLGMKQTSTQTEREILLNHFFVAGLQYHGWESIYNHVEASTELQLRPEPYNPYDRFAVAIFYRQVKIGYVPRGENKHISRMICASVPLKCTLRKIDPEAPSWRRVRVEVSLLQILEI